MTKNVFYEGEAFPKDFYENEDSYKAVYESEKDKAVDKSKNNGRLLPMQLMLLLPSISAQLLYYLFSSTIKKDGKGYFYPTTFKYIKMTEDDFDAALQTLIDNGIVYVSRRDESVYEYIVNYDKINEFVFIFKDMLNMEKINLSTDITFRNITYDSCSIDELTDDQMKELTYEKVNKFLERFYSIQKKKEMVEEDSLFGEKERQRKDKDEMARKCFLLSKKNVGKVSE